MLNATLLTAASAELGGAFSAERWAYAGRMTLLGMVMVFSVLVLLWLILTIFKLVMVGNTPKVQESKGTVANLVAERVTAVEETKVAPVANDDEALVAVIAAAVAAYRAGEGMDEADASAFRVVSFRHVTNGRAWNANR